MSMFGFHFSPKLKPLGIQAMNHHIGEKKKVKERKPSGKSNVLPQTDNLYSLGN